MGKVRKGSQRGTDGHVLVTELPPWGWHTMARVPFSPCCHPRWAGCSWPGIEEEEEEEEGSGLVVSTGGNGLEPLLALALRGNAWQLPPSPTHWVVGAEPWWVPMEIHPSGWVP